MTVQVYNQILLRILGSQELVARWWVTSNLAFGGLTPLAKFESDPKAVHDYLVAQISGDYS